MGHQQVTGRKAPGPKTASDFVKACTGCGEVRTVGVYRKLDGGLRGACGTCRVQREHKRRRTSRRTTTPEVTA